MAYQAASVGSFARLGLRTYRRALDFSGRSTRTEIVAFWLVSTLLLMPLALSQSAEIAFPRTAGDIRLALGFTAVQLLIYLPILALLARRAHDFGWPGWPVVMAALVAIASEGWRDWHFRTGGPLFLPTPWEVVRGAFVLITLAMMFWPPSVGENRYGPDPRTA